MNTIWQFELKGYDSATDATDDRIRWVYAPDKERAIAYMREGGFLFHPDRVVEVDMMDTCRLTLIGVDYAVPGGDKSVKIPFEPEVQGDHCMGQRYRIPDVIDGRGPALE